ncbi:MAG TPA: squalene synthase HpnC [Actinomycetales bacterium]|nr:squalene synthase HpnC [Actinomycetales bacterium]
MRTGVPFRGFDRQVRGENFPVALRVLPPATRAHLLAIYSYARYVDDLGDEGEAGEERERALRRIADDVLALAAGDAPRDPRIQAIAPTFHGCRLRVDALLRLVDANLMDQKVTRYETFQDLLGYCELSANPVGELVLAVFGRHEPHLVELSDRVCTALQLLEHWQDIAEDRRRGRIYLPRQDMERFGVAETDLDGAHASESLRLLLAFETDRAEAWLEAGSVLVPALTGWARLAVSGYVAGGRAAARCLAMAGYDPLPAPPKPRRLDIARAWLRATVRSPG